MNLSKILKNAFLVMLASLVLTACATKKTTTGQMQGDVYTGTDSLQNMQDFQVNIVKTRFFHRANTVFSFLKLVQQVIIILVFEINETKTLEKT